MADFLSEFMGNTERAKVLRVFVFEEARALTAAEAGKRAGLTAKIVEREIQWFEKRGILKREFLSIMLKNNPSQKVSAKHQKVPAWTFDDSFKYARALSSFVHEVSPIQHESIMQALKRACPARGAKLSAVILSGSFMGDPSRPADLLVAADTYNERRLDDAIRNLEPSVGREIRYAAFSTPEFRYRLTIQDRLIRDTLDFPHVVLLDRTRLL